MDDFEEYEGGLLKICYCEEDPSESWDEAIRHIQPHRQKSTTAKMTVLKRRLAEVGRLNSPDQFNTEGNLPNGNHFYAIKAYKIRAYGWFSKGAFYISHFAYKYGQNLRQADTNRVVANWRKIEEQ